MQLNSPRALLLLALLIFCRTAGSQEKKSSDVPMTRPQELLAIHDTRFYHSSTFVELDGGRILQAAKTLFTTSDDGGLTWSKPFECKDSSGKPVGGEGSSLVKLSGKGIGLAAIDFYDPKNFRKNRIVFWRSPDEGKTWEPPITVTPPGLWVECLQDCMLRTSSGRLIIPIDVCLGQYAGPNQAKHPQTGKLVRNQWVSTAAHFFDATFSAVAVYYSDDDGKTWESNQDGELMILQDWNAGFHYVCEPSVTEVAPGRLLMVMRTVLGRLFQSWSNDNGQTWTRPQPSALAASTSPAQIRRLPTGHLLMVWNQESEEEIKRGYNRTRLSAAISRNGGSIWEFFQNVESLREGTRFEPGPIRPVVPAEISFAPGLPAPARDAEYIDEAEAHVRCAYPSVFVMKDRVLIAHTYGKYEEHPAKAQLARNSEGGGNNQKLKILPLKWFYGGKEPAANPFLRDAYQPAKP